MTYSLYNAPGEPEPTPSGAAGDAKGGWQILVEYSNKGQAKPPTLIEVFESVYSSREKAHSAAKRLAENYKPPDPWSPQGRHVYADGPDGFLTIVRGATQTFHFSTRVVRFVSSE